MEEHPTLNSLVAEHTEAVVSQHEKAGLDALNEKYVAYIGDTVMTALTTPDKEVEQILFAHYSPEVRKLEIDSKCVEPRVKYSRRLFSENLGQHFPGLVESLHLYPNGSAGWAITGFVTSRCLADERFSASVKNYRGVRP